MGTDEELFIRWSQAAVLTTHFRVHNSALSGLREPWSFGARTEALWKDLALLHSRAVPLVRRLWSEASQSGLLPTEPIRMATLAAAIHLPKGVRAMRVGFLQPSCQWRLRRECAVYSALSATGRPRVVVLRQTLSLSRHGYA